MVKNRTLIGCALALLVAAVAWFTPQAPGVGVAVQFLTPTIVATTGNVAPYVRQQYFDNSGTVLASGKLCTYAAGTTTPLATYSDQTLSTPNTNPIILDTAGRFQTNVYLNTASYKFVLLSAGTTTDCTTGTTIFTADNIQGAAGTDASVLSSGNLPWAQLPSGSGTWTGTPTISGALNVTSSSNTAFTVTGGASIGGAGLTIDPTGVLTSTVQARASVYNNAVQSVSDSSVTALTFNTEEYDVGGMHSTSSNTSRLTVPAGQGGLYAFCGATTFAASNTGAREMFFRKNGTTSLNGQPRNNSPSAGSQENLTLCRQATLSAGDYIELMVFQSSGGALNVGDSAAPTESAVQIMRLW